VWDARGLFRCNKYEVVQSDRNTSERSRTRWQRLGPLKIMHAMNETLTIDGRPHQQPGSLRPRSWITGSWGSDTAGDAFLEVCMYNLAPERLLAQYEALLVRSWLKK
jgi:hypothetical protein